MNIYDVLSTKYPPLVSIEQLAVMTGIKDRTYRHWLSCGRMPIPVVRLGGSIRFKLLDVANWIDGGQETATRRRGRPTKAEAVARNGGGR